MVAGLAVLNLWVIVKPRVDGAVEHLPDVAVCRSCVDNIAEIRYLRLVLLVSTRAGKGASNVHGGIEGRKGRESRS